MRKATLALMMMTGCVVLRGSGELGTETRTVDDVSGVEARDGVEGDFVVDPELSGKVTLNVETDDNLLDRVITEVDNGVLVIDVEGSVSTRLGMRVWGDLPPLDSVHGVDGASLTVKGLGGERLLAIAEDGASVTLRGEVGTLTVEAKDGASLRAEGLTADSADVDVTDGASAHLCVTGRVTGSVRDGASLEVSCGGNASGVQVSDGGSVRD